MNKIISEKEEKLVVFILYVPLITCILVCLSM